jgi:hypothetical protein
MFMASLIVVFGAGGLLYALRGVPQKDITGVAQAIDGDSLKLAGEEVRLKGIDAPEFTQTCQVSGREVACGRESRAALRKLLSTARLLPRARRRYQCRDGARRTCYRIWRLSPRGSGSQGGLSRPMGWTVSAPLRFPQGQPGLRHCFKSGKRKPRPRGRGFPCSVSD